MNKKSLAILALAVLCVGLMVAFHGNWESSVAEKMAKPLAVPAVSAVARSQTAQASLATLPTNQTATVRGTKPFVLESRIPFGKSLRREAEALGARTIGVLSPTRLLVEADAAARVRLAADRRFSSVSEFLPAEKVSARLARALNDGARTVQVAFILLSPEDRQRVQEEVVAKGGEILTGCLNTDDSFRARVSAELVAEFATHGDVQWLEPFERPHLMNDMAVEPAAMNVRTTWDAHGLSGAGQIITTSDSGIDTGDMATLHEDLRDRVVGIKVVEGCSTKDLSGHGTHTAGSIVGNGSNSLERAEGPIRGTAWGAQLYAWFCGLGSGSSLSMPSDYNDLFRPEQDKYPAFIHSASWGSTTYGEYDSSCAAVDNYVWYHPDFLPVYAAGNEGDAGASTVGSPAASKNILTVGATQNVREGSFPEGSPFAIPSGNPMLTADYSSRGPCLDGRIKPDIAAPGSGILSTRARGVDYGYGVYDDNYAFDCGTSMACPLTAGSVALVREWLVTRRDFTNEPPTAALMKAVITGGAKGAATPGNDQGWGRVDLAETLFPSNRAVKLVDRIPFAENEEFVWVIETTNTAPLDVQLAWIDRCGSVAGPQTSARLVNDLNLTVRPLDGDESDILYGNGGTGEDNLNTLESVRIAEAAPNRYLISVDCKTVLYDHTEGGAAALYVRGAFDPEAPEIKYGRVRIRETGELYLSLDKALEAAQDGATVEILEKVGLRESVTITNSVTVVATNANPSVSMVIPQAGATLTLTNGVTAFFTNVVFRHDERLTVDALTGSVIRVAGPVDLGEIRLATAENLCQAGVLSVPIVVDAPFIRNAGEVFGRLENYSKEAEKSACYLLNKYDEECGGECFFDSAASTYRLRWLSGAPVPDAAAAARIEPEQAAYTNYRSLAVLFKYTKTGTVSVMKSTRLTNAIELVNLPLTIRGVGTGIVLSPTDESGFVVGEGASLMLTNITVRNRRGGPFIDVKGGSFTLEKDASLQNLAGTGPESGAVALRSGTVTTRPDSSIRGCDNEGTDGNTAGGGAVWMLGENCVLNLEGGRITQCSALTVGGAVFAVNPGAEVNLSGPLWVCDNMSGSSDYIGMDDDLCLANSSLTLKGNLTGGYVGMAYTWDFPEEDKPFCAVAPELQGQVTDFTLACFLCEDQGSYSDEGMTAVVSGDGKSLVWEALEYSARTEPDPERDVARIVRDNVTTNYYYFIDGPGGAFDDLDRDGLVIELLQPCDFVEDIPVSRAVTVRLAYARDAGYDIYREADCGFVIGKGGDLTLDGVYVSGSRGGSGRDVAAPLFKVAGGALLLTNDTFLANVSGAEGRASGAVVVSAGGVFTMTDGTAIDDCQNSYEDEIEKTGVGAALLVDNGTAYLKGGEICFNSASRAAGVNVGNDGRVYVSGELIITDNTTLDHEDSDLVVEGHGELLLDGDLTGWSEIGYQEGVDGDGIDTNVFARVSGKALKACGDVAGATNYVTSAARFFRDDAPWITGLVVTNDTGALLVWSYAVSGGVYKNDAGQVYGAVSAARVDAPSSVPGLVYTGFAQTGVVAVVDAYVLTGNVATNAGSYTAEAELKPGYLWSDGSALPKKIDWSIGKATYDMSGITFEDKTFVYDGTPKSIFISGELPQGVMTNYIGNGVIGPCVWKEVRVRFSVADPDNYNTPKDKVAHITITDAPGPGTETTNFPSAIAFKSIDRVSDYEWSLVVTDRVQHCRYRLLSTDDLTKGFTTTGAWATAEAAGPWETNVTTSTIQYFWKAEGTWGIVPKDE